MTAYQRYKTTHRSDWPPLLKALDFSLLEMEEKDAARKWSAQVDEWRDTSLVLHKECNKMEYAILTRFKSEPPMCYPVHRYIARNWLFLNGYDTKELPHE